MPPPYVAHAVCRIVGEIHGQQTVNVLHFTTHDAIADEGELDTILLQLATAMLACVIDTLLPAVTSDWKVIQCDAKRISPAVSDPILATAPAGSVGQLSAASVSFASSLVSVRTGGGGKSGRGRLFLPPPGEAQTTASSIDAGTLVLIAAFVACVAGKFMGDTKTTPWQLGILSQKHLKAIGGTHDNSFREATSLNPRQDLAVMRSRRKGKGS